MLKIEEGKFYRARNGEKIGPMRKKSDMYRDYPWSVPGYGRDWTDNGSYIIGTERPEDLIAEWTDSPSVDLTKITTPFGLLDEATREALKAHGGPYEAYGAGGIWINFTPSWEQLGVTIRVRPQPPKPREYWLLILENGTVCDTCKLEEVEEHRSLGRRVIHVREVL